MYNQLPSQQGFPNQMNPAFGMPGTPMHVNIGSSECTLYIGNLSPMTEEKNLHTVFLPYGNVLNTRIMRDIYTQETRRFGFVSFSNIEEAQKAKEAMNYQKLDNFEIRICFKKVTTEFKEGANLFVTSIPKHVSAKELDELFSECGKIVSCSIRTDNKGDSLGYAYIQFESVENAEAARLKLNESEHFGKPISVGNFVASKNRPLIKNNVYIKNFPKSWTKEKIETEGQLMFGKIGKINSWGISEHKFGEEIKWSMFVAYETQEEAKLAIENYNGMKLENASEEDSALFVVYSETKTIRVARMKKEMSTAKNLTNLFLKSLLETCTQDELKKIMSKYGEIISIGMRNNQPNFIPNGQTLQSAYVNFKTADQAQDALLNAKTDAELKAVIHPVHKKGLPFIMFHQTKSNRMEYLRMKNRITQTLTLAYNPMIYNQFQGGFKKNQNYSGFGHGQQMGMPFGMQNQMKQFPPNQGMRFPGGLPVGTPPTGKQIASGSTSRQGEDEEIFSLDYLKSHKDEFMGFDKERQNNILGNLMYHKVMESGLSNKDLAPKITGMLIDLDILDISEIIEIMENKESLNERVNEALEVINSNED